MSTPHGNVPQCTVCSTQLTVRHILCDCRNYTAQRNLYLRNKSLKEILSDSNEFYLDRILTFLTKTNLIDKI